MTLILLLALAPLACRTFTGTPLKFSPELLPQAQVGQFYTVTITLSGNRTPAGDIYVSEGELPQGLEMHFQEKQDSAEISGIPEKEGDYQFTVSFWCLGTNVSGQTGQQDFTLSVK